MAIVVLYCDINAHLFNNNTEHLLLILLSSWTSPNIVYLYLWHDYQFGLPSFMFSF